MEENSNPGINKSVKIISLDEIEEKTLLEYQFVNLNETDWAFKDYFLDEDAFINWS